MGPNMITSERSTPTKSPAATYNGEVAAGFFIGCLPFVASSGVSTAIMTLNIISDWIMYNTLRDLNLPDEVDAYTRHAIRSNHTMEGDPLLTDGGVYKSLPILLQVFLVIASVVYVLHFIWLLVMTQAQRNKFKDKRDGVPHKKKMAELYAGDVLSLLHVIFETIPVSTILLLAQKTCSCSFIIPFDDGIYLLVSCTAFVGLIWKLVSIAWHMKSCKDHGKYVCSPAEMLLKGMSVISICSALVLTAINLSLLAGHESELFVKRDFNNYLFDKIGIDQYLSRHYVVFLQHTTLQNDSIDDSNSSVKNEVVNIHTISNLKDIVQKNDQVIYPCYPPPPSLDGIDFVPLFEKQHQQYRHRNCSVILKFRHAKYSREIQFDSMYRFLDESGMCISGKLQIAKDNANYSFHKSSLAAARVIRRRERGDGGNVGAQSTADTGALGSKGVARNTPSDHTPTQAHSTPSDNAGNSARQLSTFSLRLYTAQQPEYFTDCHFLLIPNKTLLSRSDQCTDEV